MLPTTPPIAPSIDFFGDKETVTINMIRYMRKRINDDGLTKIIQNQQSEQQI